jgi:hypothetical protein
VRSWPGTGWRPVIISVRFGCEPRVGCWPSGGGRWRTWLLRSGSLIRVISRVGSTGATASARLCIGVRVVVSGVGCSTQLSTGAGCLSFGLVALVDWDNHGVWGSVRWVWVGLGLPCCVSWVVGALAGPCCVSSRLFGLVGLLALAHLRHSPFCCVRSARFGSV